MSETLITYLADENATVAAGIRIGQQLQDGAIIYLEGVLGAGKTTVCRGVLNAFGYSGAVKSPTYTLVEPYQLGARQLFHFDLYRLGDPEELEYMGMRDYFQPQHICLVEWPVRGEGFLPVADLVVTLQPEGRGRKLTIAAGSERGATAVRGMSHTN